MTPMSELIFVMFLPLAAAKAAALGQPFKRLPITLLDPALEGRVLIGERPLKGRDEGRGKAQSLRSFSLPLPYVLGVSFTLNDNNVTKTTQTSALSQVSSQVPASPLACKPVPKMTDAIRAGLSRARVGDTPWGIPPRDTPRGILTWGY